MIGSPTALADCDIERSLSEAATSHGLYIPTGALWGAADTRKMAEVRTKVGSCTVWTGRHSPDNREVLMTGSGAGTLSMYQYEYPDKRSKNDRDGNTVYWMRTETYLAWPLMGTSSTRTTRGTAT